MTKSIRALENLPVWRQKDIIQESVQKNDLVILEGEAGSGKSTVVPYLLYEMGYSVVVTQPRRLPAEALAKYLSSILGVELGGTVGFWHGLRKEASEETRILFCTDGLEVVLQIGRELDGRQHEYVLVLDEIHEWNLNQEILIAILKAAYAAGKHLKVVILSATMQSDKLKAFFDVDCKVDVLSVSGRLFPVEFHELPKMVPASEDSYLGVDSALITAERLVKEEKNVLLFYPGKKEIYQAAEILSQKVDAEILPLHSELTAEEQQRCFEKYNRPKVVLATNLAQTSITLPDIDAVVDTGEERRKEVVCGIEGLYLKPISQAGCTQRKGRAGRTHAGEYYLCSDVPFKRRNAFSLPEVQRSLLDQLVLRLMSIGMDPEELKFFHQPSREAIVLAKKSLERMGALDHQQVTKIGRELALLPIEARYGRMILKANELGVVDDVITITAILSVGSLLHRKEGAYSQFSRERKSDLLAELDIWNRVSELDWEELKMLPINHKNLSRVKETRKKLFLSLEGKVQFGSSGERDKILEACLYGMLGQIFVCTYRQCYSEDGIPFSLDRNSVCSASEFVFGIPHTIEFVNRYGQKDTIDLISMASVIEKERIEKLIPQCFERREDSVIYTPKEDACLVSTNIFYGGIKVDEEIRIDYHHPQYEVCKKNFQESWWDSYQYERLEKKLKRQNRQKEILVAGKVYPLRYNDFLENANPTISVMPQELFGRLLDTKQIRLENGNLVTVICSCQEGNNLDQLRTILEKQEMERAWRKLKESFEGKSSSKRNVILGWKDNLGEILVYQKQDGTRVFAYPYLLYKNGSFQIELSEEDCSDITQESLQKLFEREFEKILTEKSFKILGHDGKKVLTKKGQEALQELKEYIRLLASEITFENFESSVTEILEIYEEKLQEVKAG